MQEYFLKRKCLHFDKKGVPDMGSMLRLGCCLQSAGCGSPLLAYRLDLIWGQSWLIDKRLASSEWLAKALFATGKSTLMSVLKGKTFRRVRECKIGTRDCLSPKEVS